jgi:hypothetical protein
MDHLIRGDESGSGDAQLCTTNDEVAEVSAVHVREMRSEPFYR